MINTYTLIINGTLGPIVNCTYSELQRQLGELDSYLNGAYPKNKYKLVFGEVEELTQLEKDAKATIRTTKTDETTKKIVDRKTLKAIQSETVDFCLTQTEAKNHLDFAAGDARARFNSRGDFISDEYQRILKDAEKYRDSLGVTVGRFLQVYADNYGLTVADAADKIEAREQEYDDYLYNISQIRRQGKAAIMDASENYYKAAMPFIEQLDQI